MGFHHYGGGFSSDQNNRSLRKSFSQDSENSGIRLAWILAFIFLLSILGVSSLFIFFSGGDSISSSFGSDGESQKTAFSGEYSNDSGEGASSRGNLNDTFPFNIEGTNLSSVLDCGDEIDCLIASAGDCGLANGTIQTTFDLFGDVMTTISFYEIRGGEDGKCFLYSRFENQTHDYSEEMRSQLVEEGMTDAELDQFIEEVNEASKALIGFASICSFDSGKDLAAYLMIMKEGELDEINLSLNLDPSNPSSVSQVDDINIICETVSF
ncbi:MAG: hypothetical protein KKC19_03475 [Nanoarchaeota archaeon]|nr:hypothetical protein [Nanoarchaeota archaeon]